MTYGDLSSLIHFVAMELCTDLKLKEQLKKDKKFSSNELGSFCQVLCFPSLKPPFAKRVSKKERSGKSTPKRRSSKEKGYSKGKRSRKTSRNTSNEDKCWTCGKSGHKSPDCPRNKRKRKKINLLEVDEETKEKFLSILNEEESDSSSSSEEEETEDEEFLNVDQDSGHECNCQGKFCHCDS